MPRLAERTPTDIEITPLDLTSRKEDALTFVRENKEPKATEATFMSWGIVETPQGIFALCTEGVGPGDVITDEAPLVIDVNYRIDNPDGKGGSFSAFPVASFTLNDEEVREFATGEPVNLAEWVRTFGNRLEVNYEGWRRALEAAMQEEVAV